MKKGIKKNSILDDGHTSDLFSQETHILSSPRTPRVSKTTKKKNSSRKTPSSRSTLKSKTKSQSHKIVKPSRVLANKRRSTEMTLVPVTEEESEDQEQQSVWDPNTVTIITVSEKISKRLAQHLWQELSPKVLKSLQDLILNVYIEPVVLQTSKSDKVRDRLRELIRQLISELSNKLLAVKLPVFKNPNFLNLESVVSKKLYLESVLSSNLKQIEILEKELIKFEKIYNSDLEYFNNLTKAISRDELVRNINLDENLEHELINLKQLKPRDPNDDEFDQLLSKLDKHLVSINNNVEELVELNGKVELVNELLLLI